MRTPFTDLVGCELPIQMAAMGGGVTSLRLARAVPPPARLSLDRRLEAAAQVAAVVECVYGDTESALVARAKRGERWPRRSCAS